MTAPGPHYQPNQAGQPYSGYQVQHPDPSYAPQQAGKKKGGCMKWALIVFGAFVVIALIAGIAGGGDESGESAATGTTTVVVPPGSEGAEPAGEADVARAIAPDAEPASAEVESEPSPEPRVAPTLQPEPAPAEPEVSREHQNAVRSANQYLNYTSFSRQGLIEQLQFENYSLESAQYAVDNVDADWNEQAVKKAGEYLNYTSFSRQGLVDQLIFEGFTAEQAEFGAAQAY